MLNLYFKTRRPLTWLLVFTLLLGLTFALFAAPAEAVNQAELNALKRQQEQISQQRANIQSQANGLSSALASQTEKLRLLSEQLELTNSEIEILSEQIAIYTNSIAKMENELNLRRQEELKLLKQYKTRMRAMEENGSFAYISILLGAESFQDLLSRLNDIKAVMEYDANLIEDVRKAQIEVQNAKAEMESEIEFQRNVFEQFQQTQADLLLQQTEAQTVLDSLSADSANYNEQLDAVMALQSAINGQINNMENGLAEQDRLQSEQNSANDISNDDASYGDSSGSGSGTGQTVIDYAMGFLGVNYVYGGTSPSGFDCSGLVYYCYKHFGYSLNRTAAGLAYNGTAVSKSELQVGDVILFASGGGGYIGHTGMYVGNGQFIHAPHTGDVVKISDLSSTYYTNNYWGARRIA